MDRRKFLKISCAGIVAGALPSVAARATELTSLIRPAKWKVTVVRRQCFQDLQSCYLEDPEAGYCPLVKGDFEGEFLLAGNMPRSLERTFCPKAWKALAEAAQQSFSCGKTVGNAILASCGDPTRPVIFKIEKSGTR